MRRAVVGVTAVAVLTGAVIASTEHSPAVASHQQPVGINAAERAPVTRSYMARLVTRNGYRVNTRQIHAELRVAASLIPPKPTTTKPVVTTIPKPVVTTTVPTTSANNPATTGMGYPGSFQACVAWRESSDGQASSDVYGILPYIWTDVIGFPGSPYYASLAEQDAAFWKLYYMDGTSPWAPYDGC